jgi:hypothetical protein
MAGCDSIATLVLTINLPNSSTTTETVCESFTWTNGMTYTSSGTYTQSLTNMAGCDSTATLELTVVNLDAQIVNTNGVTLSCSTSADSYQWIDCTTLDPVVGETSSTYSPTVNGTYAVVINVGNCSDTSNCVVVDQIELNENTKANFEMYPNPSSGKVTIKLESLQTVTIQVLDLNGRSMYVFETNQSKIDLDLGMFEKGAYFILVNTPTSTVNKKLIIH